MGVVRGLGVERVSRSGGVTVDPWDGGAGFHAFFLRS